MTRVSLVCVVILFLCGCGPKQNHVRELEIDSAAGYPVIIATPVQFGFRGSTFKAQSLRMNFGGANQYAFGLAKQVSNNQADDPDLEVDRVRPMDKSLRINRGWIFINKCFRTYPQVDFWPIVVGGRVSAGSDGSEFIVEMDSLGVDIQRIYYVSASAANEKIRIFVNGTTYLLSQPGRDYAEISGNTVTIGDYTTVANLRNFVETATELAELAGVRCACTDCPH